MSGICGWSNNQLDIETGSRTLRAMASRLLVNPGHSVDSELFSDCGLASVGMAKDRGIARNDGIFAAIHGSIRWPDENLAMKATEFGPAQAIIDAYRDHRHDFLSNLYGSFAFCIVDQDSHRTMIAVDRLGMHTLYFATRRGQLIFASDARAVQCHPDTDRTIDMQALFDYFYFHMVPSPRCIFSGVEKLEPAQYLVFENNEITRRYYWQPDYLETRRFDFETSKVEFLDLLTTCVSHATESANCGAFLSGGTDSSTIAGILRRVSAKPPDTYSIGFDVENYDEMTYARIASRHFQTQPHEYYLTPQDVVDAIPMVVEAYDEPFGNASAVPAYYCARLARSDGIDTLLAGDGGDELFGGNERYGKQKVFEAYKHLPYFLRKKLIEPALLKFPMGDRLGPIAKARSYVQQANIPLPDRLESYNFLNRMRLEDIFSEDFLSVVKVDEPGDLLREVYLRPGAASSVNRMLFLDLKFTLADNDLRKVSRMCERAHVEVRYPLLDNRMVDFSAALPVSMKVRGVKLRYFFKAALKDFLPKEIINKPKHGFGLPFGAWVNSYSPLREIAQDSLSAFAKRHIVKQEFVGNLLRLNQTHPNYYGVMIWVLMILEQWLQASENTGSTRSTED